MGCCLKTDSFLRVFVERLRKNDGRRLCLSIEKEDFEDAFQLFKIKDF